VSRNDDGTFVVSTTWSGGTSLRLAGYVDGASLGGVAVYDTWPMQPLAGWAVDGRALVDPPPAWPIATPAEVGVDPAALEAFVETALRGHSDAVAIAVDGKLLVYRAPQPAPTNVHSITKPIASLAVPFLLQEGHVASLDQPLGEVLDGWADDPRGAVTLRHVLTHTTGLEREPDADEVINRHPDRRALVLASPLVDEPGTAFAYSNRAMGLIPAVVQATTGSSLAAYLEPRLMEPLGIDAGWSHDPAGSTAAFGGLRLTVLDLVRIGQLLLDDGQVDGVQVLPEGWAQLATQPSGIDVARGMGLAWFLEEDGTWGHSGGGGQWLRVDPATGLVFARLHTHHAEAPSTHGGRAVASQAMELLPANP